MEFWEENSELHNGDIYLSKRGVSLLVSPQIKHAIQADCPCFKKETPVIRKKSKEQQKV